MRFNVEHNNVAEDLLLLNSRPDSDEEGDESLDEAFLDLCCCVSSKDDSCCNVIFCSHLGRFCLIMAAFLFVCLLVFVFPINGQKQSTDVVIPRNIQNRGERIIASLCQNYKNKKLSGDLCSTICNAKNWTLTDFQQGANKRVLKLAVGSQNLVLKATKDFFDDYTLLDPGINEEDLVKTVVELVNARIGFEWPYNYRNHLMKHLWSTYNQRKTEPQLSEADKNSLWALLDQDEFITFKLLPLSRVTTKVQGSCGHFYSVDSLLPFKMKGYYMGLKAKILVHLMGTLKLFYEFLNEPLQWCDVKFENLGLSANYPKRFVVMDADMLYTESRLNQILTSRKCETDKDCEYFDCHASCINSTGMCSTRVNDNIDVFCDKLVGRLFGTYWSKSNHYLSACHDKSGNRTKRLDDLRLVWSWSLSDV
ncbi:unnamed protein product [Bursaphelenchus xylophilus]|uniref:(pine wood nematode) hypothetical protein n=1 Tax=Bursaphelenchus xylophilus TaxID=6326 RepID=A0A1I7RLF8_BURXY|nr:unnamed protein product [Bursaphelenchus xylophilus]CAG9083031.1 unnamed protein product [Bursaphelenchus xylophilus]